MFKNQFVECPCCGQSVSTDQMYCNKDNVVIIGVLICQHCDAVFNVKEQLIALERAIEIVDLTKWDTGEAQTERYFDFVWIDRTGKIDRSHGWYNPQTRRITQSG